MAKSDLLIVLSTRTTLFLTSNFDGTLGLVLFRNENHKKDALSLDSQNSTEFGFHWDTVKLAHLLLISLPERE